MNDTKRITYTIIEPSGQISQHTDVLGMPKMRLVLTYLATRVTPSI